MQVLRGSLPSGHAHAPSEVLKASTFAEGVHSVAREPHRQQCAHSHLRPSAVATGGRRQQIGRAAATGSLAGASAQLPLDFDWRAYLEWSADLADNGVTTRSRAIQHYLRHGRNEGRLYKRYRLVVLYWMDGGEDMTPVSVETV